MIEPIRTTGWSSQKKARTKLRHEGTPAERILWEKLKGKQLEGNKFRRQHGIGPFITDFYHPVSMTVIEIDGSIHDLQETKKTMK